MSRDWDAWVSDHLGRELVGIETSWEVRDALVLAAAVGANFERDDRFLLEQFGPQLLPTFASVATGSWLSELSRQHYSDANLLVGGFEYSLHSALPVSGSSRTSAMLSGVESRSSLSILWHTTTTIGSKGSMIASGTHALVLVDAGVGDTRGEIGYRTKIRTAGHAEPDHVEVVDVDRRAIELYRPVLPLRAGEPGPDPVHTSASAARATGLPASPLHSMAVIGHVGLAVSRAFPSAHAKSVAGFGARYRRAVYPGDRLRVEMRVQAGGLCRLDVTNGGGERVLDAAWIALEPTAYR